MPKGEKGRSRFRRVLDSLRRLLGKKPPPAPGDPYAYRMAPLRDGPRGRSGTAAVAEPEDDSYRAYPPRRH